MGDPRDPVHHPAVASTGVAGAAGVDALGLPDAIGVLGRLVRLGLLVDRILEQHASRAGISVADSLVLSAVRRAPDGRAGPARLCEVLGRTSGGLSLALDRLGRAGLVRRTPDPGDRRRVLVEATPEGVAVAARVHADLDAWETGLGLAPAEHREVVGTLDRLLARLDERLSEG